MANNSNRPDRMNPASGENSSERPTPNAWFQSTPLVPAAEVAIN